MTQNKGVDLRCTFESCLSVLINPVNYDPWEWEVLSIPQTELFWKLMRDPENEDKWSNMWSEPASWFFINKHLNTSIKFFK